MWLKKIIQKVSYGVPGESTGTPISKGQATVLYESDSDAKNREEEDANKTKRIKKRKHTSRSPREV